MCPILQTLLPELSLCVLRSTIDLIIVVALGFFLQLLEFLLDAKGLSS